MGRYINADMLYDSVVNSMNDNPHKDPTKGICHKREHQHFLNLIDMCPTVDTWIPRDTPPVKNGRYLCRYTFGSLNGNNMWFYQVFDYYATDEVPHFQHELNAQGSRNTNITHWMPINLLEDIQEDE